MEKHCSKYCRGMQMILFLETPEYIHGITDGNGARVVIHEPDTIPHPTQEGFFVPAAFETSIGLKLVSVTRLGKPFGTCTDQDIFFQEHGVKYTFQTCLWMCKARKVIEVCNCLSSRSYDNLLRTKISTDVKLCETKKERKCARKFAEKVRSKTLQCDCPQACKENKYTKFISTHQYPSSDYVYMLLKGVCERNRRHCVELKEQVNEPRLLSLNFLKLVIYYEELNYEHIKETPEIEDAQFLSDVGGALGLWIGLSLLSVFEVIQLIVEMGSLLLLRPTAIRPRKQSCK
ncbi:FMRFamide-activated amiloride-sensitive sodium channel-like isoform X2 [Mizuhopecten yessoensis]|uniref:FMRFamide-activated amiloride-sensitive sodium channel-like isoform X2 n=1 Tax=Mizuhopecten yessoensis TaxID=6573 RepID=UPI000B45E2A1|nr:FMRFamide-activated amiloride-sensitive sodium channel-like isoform X2 [Mizuhopecten yessoensis]